MPKQILSVSFFKNSFAPLYDQYKVLLKTLKKYWGYDAFRPLQADIIQSIIEGNDTIALLPTGGGKSICFQVPALIKEGVCIVFTPLIALMKDQVDGLVKRGISAAAIYSGLSHREINLIYQNTLYGKYKFLYISPERAKTKLFLSFIINFKVSFIAVDEAHCISQWGHNFRPEYLQIGELRALLPAVPVMAVTATATKAVLGDMKKYLSFTDKSKLFKKSFHRDNLSYLVIKEENKLERIVKVLKKVPGTALVYGSTRKQCEQTHLFLHKNGISSAYYHAGLNNQQRNTIQQDWIENKTRVVCCTNAFGMGIDKPDVRLVIHQNIVESPEAYYQEAGRAGRDGNEAFCINFYDNTDDLRLRNGSFPEFSEIEKVLNSLYNYHAVAFGSGENTAYPVHLGEFCQRFSLFSNRVFQVLKVLESLAYLKFEEDIFDSSKIKILATNEELYKYQVKHPKMDIILKTMLRSYVGMFDHYVLLDETTIAKRVKIPVSELIKALEQMTLTQILEYVPQRKGSYLTYLIARPTTYSWNQKHYNELVQREIYRRDYMMTYIENISECREKVLLAYFDDILDFDCGKCDICRGRKKTELNENDFNFVVESIKKACLNQEKSIEELLSLFKLYKEKSVLQTIHWLQENKYIAADSEKKYRWVNA